MALFEIEGAGKTGCLLHPRSRVRFAQTKRHTSIQGSWNTPAFPAQWLYGLLRALPGERLFCLRRRRDTALDPTGSMRNCDQINSTGKSLLIFRNRVKLGNQKYSAFVLPQISPITPPVSRQMRGVGHRHERAVRCDGREWRDRRTRRMRTVKSCGSGAAVLALRWREVSRRQRRQKSRSPGRARSKP